MIPKYKTQHEKAFRQFFIHHSVSGTKCTDVSKTQTKCVVFVLPPLVRYKCIHVHDSSMHIFTWLKYTHGKESKEQKKKGQARGTHSYPNWRVPKSWKTGLRKSEGLETMGFKYQKSMLS